MSPEALQEVLWPESDADANAHRLHRSVSKARSALRNVVRLVQPDCFRKPLLFVAPQTAEHAAAQWSPYSLLPTAQGIRKSEHVSTVAGRRSEARIRDVPRETRHTDGLLSTSTRRPVVQLRRSAAKAPTFVGFKKRAHGSANDARSTLAETTYASAKICLSDGFAVAERKRECAFLKISRKVKPLAHMPRDDNWQILLLDEPLPN